MSSNPLRGEALGSDLTENKGHKLKADRLWVIRSKVKRETAQIVC